MLNINLSRGCIFAYVGRIFQMAVVFSDISCKNPFMQGFNLPQSSITLSLAFSMMKSFQSKCHTLCLLLNKYYLFWLIYILAGYISIVFFLLRSFSLISNQSAVKTSGQYIPSQGQKRYIFLVNACKSIEVVVKKSWQYIPFQGYKKYIFLYDYMI